MASGLPVVAARVGGNPELVAHGSTGALYDPAAPDALAAALAAYADGASLRREHGLAARRRICDGFSLEAMVGGYESFYDELVGRTGS
jgi:glycosyltransferase involved in cell wall biosynthesis